MLSSPLILEKIKKSYTQGKNQLEILKDVSFEMKPSEMTALIGPSGSGKTTMLQITGLLDKADSGKIIINGKDVTKAGDSTRTKTRRKDIGFIYQLHHLLPEFTAIQNVMMPLLIRGETKLEATGKAEKILDKLGLKKRVNHLPTELSGGEQQRVAIARAIVGKPSLLLADEPTGNLDPKTSDEVFKLMLDIIAEEKIACLMVTHNIELAKKLKKRVTIKDGVLVKA